MSAQGKAQRRPGLSGRETNALKGRHDEPRSVSPFQGFVYMMMQTQGGGNAREACVALSWAGVFGPFQGKYQEYTCDQ